MVKEITPVARIQKKGQSSERITFNDCQAGKWFLLCVVVITCISVITSCYSRKDQTEQSPFSDTLAIISERDLIPEGTAYDPKKKRVFISSMYKRKIIAIENNGRYYDYVKSGQDDLWSTFGMEVDPVRNKLWVISTKGKAIPAMPEIQDDQWSSKVYCYNLSDGILDNIYQINPENAGEVGFNDLAISQAGDVYITESLTGKLLVLRNGADYIEEFLKPEGYTFLNGISLSTDDNFAFVSSTQGQLRVNLSTKAYEELEYEFTVNPAPVDGLAFFKNSLIGHQSNQITRFYLNERLDSIVGHEILVDKNLNSSTTGEVGDDGSYYYIANSQIRSGVDYTNKRIKPLDSLQDVIIKRTTID